MDRFVRIALLSAFAIPFTAGILASGCSEDQNSTASTTLSGGTASTGTASTGSEGAGGNNTGGSGGGSSTSGGGGGPVPTQTVACQGKLYECGDLIDNDMDGKLDSQDPDCLGPCDNTENSFYGGIPGQAGPACIVDCYFDQDSGAGNDDCHWNHACDPNEVDPNYYPEPENGTACKYDPMANTPGTGSSCAELDQMQSDACLNFCGPLTPNGCDCFGCCELPAGGGQYVFLGSIDKTTGQPSCKLADLADPDKCHPCKPVQACLNGCGTCELCIGKDELPPECNDGTGGGGGAGGAGGDPLCALAERRCERTITYPLGGEGSVELRGNFKPDAWSSGVPMIKTDSGWSATIEVPWGVAVQYKFVIDGATWKEDPFNESTINDGYGGVNSVLDAAMCAPYTCAPEPSLRFAVIGDYGAAVYGGAFVGNEASVAVLVASLNPAFIVTLGDNNYPNGLAETIDQNIGQFYHSFIHPYTGMYGEGAAENRFFPSPGNHDWNSGTLKAYTDYFELPSNERYYDVARGPVHIFCLDSEPQEPDGITPESIQGLWLKQGLALAPEPFKIVAMHRPPYSSGPHGSTLEMQWPYAAWGATAVMGGHDHDYERIVKDGLPYFVNGLGGAQPYGFSPVIVEGSVVRFAGSFGAMLVEVPTDEDVMIVKALTVEGLLVDHVAIPAL
jgi:hypothetical protein